MTQAPGGTIAVHRDDALGAPFDVVLIDSVRRDGDSFTMPDFEGLVASLVMARLWKDERLTGAELAYLRKAAGIDRSTLGAAIGGSQDDISAYETGPRPMTLALEKYIRLHIFNAARRMGGGPRVDEMINYLEWTFDEWRPTFGQVGSPIEIRLRHTATGWREAPAH